MPKSTALVTASVLLLANITVSDAAQLNPAAVAEQARDAMAERRFADAADAYAQLAARFPGEPGLQANLGMALHLSAQDDDAVGPLTRAASAMPSSFPAHFYLGASLTRLQRFSDAVEPLRHAVRLARRKPSPGRCWATHSKRSGTTPRLSTHGAV